MPCRRTSRPASGGSAGRSFAPLWRSAPSRGSPRLWLLGLFALPPAAYFFWWATSLSAHGEERHRPALLRHVTGAGRRARGRRVHRIARRHRALAVVVAVLAVGATAWNLPDKIDTARFPTDVYEPLHETLDVALDDAVVFVASDDVERFTNFRYPFLRNPPGLDGPVLYAADRHAENASLIDRSGRTGYLAHREISPGDDIFSAHWVLTPLSLSQGPEVHLRPVVTLPDDGRRPPTGSSSRTATGEFGRRPSPPRADRGCRAHGAVSGSAILPPRDRPSEARPGSHDIRIGVEDAGIGREVDAALPDIGRRGRHRARDPARYGRARGGSGQGTGHRRRGRHQRRRGRRRLRFR